MRRTGLFAAIAALAGFAGFAAPLPQSAPLLTGSGSRGKGRTATHNRGGSRAYQRAAVKARNVKRYRASLKG